MAKTPFLFLAFILLFTSSAVAETSLHCETDRKTVSADGQLVYKLIVSSSEKSISAPTLPAFAGFRVISQAQSSTAIFAESEIKTLLVYTFILAPLQPGKFNIEPSTLIVKEKTYASEGLEIEVTPGEGDLPGRHPQEEPHPLPGQDPPESAGQQITL